MAKNGRRTLVGCSLSLALLLSPLGANADPLDDVDGTEGWDQVVAPAEKKPKKMAEEDALKREIVSWESIRQLWELERSRFLIERTTHKNLAGRMTRRSGQGNDIINDSNVDQATGAGWGDAPGEQWLVPASSVDRAIDDELDESKPAPAPEPKPALKPAPKPIPAPAPVKAITPPPDAGDSNMPSAFTRRNDGATNSGGLAPTSPNPEPALPPPAKKASADDGARAAAEMLRKQKEEEEKREAEKKAQEEREAAEGAAAAAKMLKQQAEDARKEQERLRKKANLETDEEGQVVDPDLKREMEEEDEEEEE